MTVPDDRGDVRRWQGAAQPPAVPELYCRFLSCREARHAADVAALTATAGTDRAQLAEALTAHDLSIHVIEQFVAAPSGLQAERRAAWVRRLHAENRPRP